MILEKIFRFALYLFSVAMRFFVPIQKGRVLLWSTVGKEYGCNPMYISKYIIKNEPSFDVWWMFLDGVDTSILDKREKIVRFGTLKYLYILNTSEFLITNHRTFPRGIYWKKRSCQKYIMTWHGSMPIKMVEKDALSSLYDGYIKMAIEDSRNCDLMISDSKWFTKLIRNSFWYSGYILETSLPRNQIFFEKDSFPIVKSKVSNALGIPNDSNTYILLYAPTFRTGKTTSCYITEWNQIKHAIEDRVKKHVIVLMRLHPTLLKEVNTSCLITESYVKNASIYADMQELMVAADMLITDYSSTMFEFTMLNKPCFLYMPDLSTYDRDFYFSIQDLPFYKSKNIQELITNINEYDSNIQSTLVNEFISSNFCLYNKKTGCKDVVAWMINNRFK